MKLVLKNDMLKKLVNTKQNVIENKITFTLIALANQSQEVEIDFYTLKRMLNMPFYSSKRLADKLNTVKKSNLIDFSVNNDMVTVKDDKFITDEINDNFTQLDLDTLLHVKHVRSQKMFLLLSQFASTGFYTVKFDEFKDIMDCQSYKLYRVKTDVLSVIEKEIAPYCSMFKVELKRNNFIKGKPVQQISFIFRVSGEDKFFNGNYEVVDNFVNETVINSDLCSSVEPEKKAKDNSSKEVTKKKKHDKFKNKVANRVYKNRVSHIEKIPYWYDETQEDNVKQPKKDEESTEDIIKDIKDLYEKIG